MILPLGLQFGSGRRKRVRCLGISVQKVCGYRRLPVCASFVPRIGFWGYNGPREIRWQLVSSCHARAGGCTLSGNWFSESAAEPASAYAFGCARQQKPFEMYPARICCAGSGVTAITMKEQAPFITPYVPSRPSALKWGRSLMSGRSIFRKHPGSPSAGDALNRQHNSPMRLRVDASRWRPLNVRFDRRSDIASIMFHGYGKLKKRPCAGLPCARSLFRVNIILFFRFSL